MNTGSTFFQPRTPWRASLRIARVGRCAVRLVDRRREPCWARAACADFDRRHRARLPLSSDGASRNSPPSSTDRNETAIDQERPPTIERERGDDVIDGQALLAGVVKKQNFLIVLGNAPCCGHARRVIRSTSDMLRGRWTRSASRKLTGGADQAMVDACAMKDQSFQCRPFNLPRAQRNQDREGGDEPQCRDQHGAEGKAHLNPPAGLRAPDACIAAQSAPL